MFAAVRRASDTVRVTTRFKRVHVEGTERYAVYELSCMDGASESKSEVRWSDLARVHEELMHTQSATMLANKAVGLIPPFYQHLRSRIGSARFSTRFCQSRAQAMNTLLVALVRVFDVSLERQRTRAVLGHNNRAQGPLRTCSFHAESFLRVHHSFGGEGDLGLSSWRLSRAYSRFVPAMRLDLVWNTLLRLIAVPLRLIAVPSIEVVMSDGRASKRNQSVKGPTSQATKT